MTEIADRYRKVAQGFTERVTAVPADAWSNPAPCEGWLARDVVDHLVEWLPAFFCTTWNLDPPAGPSVQDDPAGAWAALNATLQAALDDPSVAGAERDTRMGRSTFEATLDMICTPDVLVHTWDLARATGLDETLDVDEVHRLVEQVESMDPAIEAGMRDSGHYGPKVELPPGAGEQDRLLAFMGRLP